MTDTPDWAAQTEQQVLDHAILLAPQTGWTRVLVRKAAAAAGLTEPEAELLLPNGPKDLAALLWRRHDAAGLQGMAGVEPQSLKIRERIRVGVQARVDVAAVDEAAVRRCSGFLSLPGNLGLGARLTWGAADLIWRWAGDVATDENHYSKRAILSGLLVSTAAVRWSAGDGAARLHLERGIDAVMQFEKAKAKFAGSDRTSGLAALLGRLRYGREPAPPGSASPP